MALTNKRYATYFNTTYNLTGHVFEERFFSKIVPDPLAMLDVSSYIHLNPVSAKMVEHPSDYSWSSFCYFSRKKRIERPSFLNLESLLHPFEGTPQHQKRLYLQYVEGFRVKELVREQINENQRKKRSYS